jgi:hypothetical protein
MESRRLLPTMTATLTFAMTGLPWLRFDSGDDKKAHADTE